MSAYIPSLTVGGLVFILMSLMLFFEFRRYGNGSIDRRLLSIRILTAVAMVILAFSVTMGTVLLANEKMVSYPAWLGALAAVAAVIILIVMDLRAVRRLYREQRRRILMQEGDDNDRRG
ncbi:MAG: hypothetical protein PHT33_02570 [bacterium]|nr:hypothetical protein [bacterium]